MIAVTAGALSAQTPPFLDLAADLASKIAAAISPASVVALAPAPSNGNDDRTMEAEAVRLLAAHGIRLAPSADVVVTFGCAENLRERACLAEIRRAGSREVVTATRPRTTAAAAIADAPPVVELTPLFAQRAPVLDVAMVGERLLVLDRTAIVLVERRASGHQIVRSQPVTAGRVWPRDLRGRLLLDGASVEAFLPGVVCRTTADLVSVSCVQDRRPWPIAIDNAGIDPSRNYFSTPEGLTFFNAASLDRPAEASWIAVDQSGTLVLLDESRKPVEMPVTSTADDVVSLLAPCRSSRYIVASSRSDESHDALRLHRIVRRRLVPQGGAVTLPGVLTALWASPAATSAVAVVHHASAGRYEAFQIHLSCDR